MITCNDMTRTPKTNLIFMPVGIMSHLQDALTDANIPYTVHNWREFLVTRNPYQVKPEYNKRINETRLSYQNAGYDNTTCIMAIETNLDPEEFFQKSLLTFGEHMDPDLKRITERYAQQSDANQKYYTDDEYVNTTA